jgi:phosphatidylinositol alpha-mannosyltransferase
VAARDSDFIRVGRPFPIPMHGSVARITVSLHLTNRIKNYVRDSGFEVIHYHEPLMPVLPVTALRFSKTCNVGTFHAFARSNVGYYYGKPLLKRYVRRLHARIAVSNPAREFVQHYFPGDYRVIPNGIDVRRFQNQAPYPELRDGMTNLLFVGRLEYRKGLGYLLRAFAQLKPQYPNLRLIIVGDGPLRRWYGNFLARKQLDDVVMAGYVPASELPRYYASCDIFCTPATGDESFGIVLLEAMASGKPIVATSIDGFREVVTHGREGLLVERKSRRQLSYALQTLINNPAMRQEMGQAGLLRARQFDWERVIDEVTEVYRQALDQAQPALSVQLEPSLSPR